MRLRRHPTPLKLYEPVEREFEREIRKRQEYWETLRKARGE